MSGEMVGRVLDRVLNGTQGPRSITMDRGTEFQSRAPEDLAYRLGVQLDVIRPGKSVENAFIESFNGRLRDEFLNVHQLTSLAEAHTIVKAWRLDYHQRRPHSSLGHLTRMSSLHNVRGSGPPKKSSALVTHCLVTRPTSTIRNSSLWTVSDRGELTDASMAYSQVG